MKSIQSIKSTSQLKSVSINKPRSIPIAQRSTQTELYMLRKEKQRYLKEVESIKKRFDFIQERLSKIDKEMLELSAIWKNEVDVIETEAAQTVVNIETKGNMTWKKRKLKY
jgi:hypothetical protein